MRIYAILLLAAASSFSGNVNLLASDKGFDATTAERTIPITIQAGTKLNYTLGTIVQPGGWILTVLPVGRIIKDPMPKVGTMKRHQFNQSNPRSEMQFDVVMFQSEAVPQKIPPLPIRSGPPLKLGDPVQIMSRFGWEHLGIEYIRGQIAIPTAHPVQLIGGLVYDSDGHLEGMVVGALGFHNLSNDTKTFDNLAAMLPLAEFQDLLQF